MILFSCKTGKFSKPGKKNCKWNISWKIYPPGKKFECKKHLQRPQEKFPSVQRHFSLPEFLWDSVQKINISSFDAFSRDQGFPFATFESDQTKMYIWYSELKIFKKIQICNCNYCGIKWAKKSTVFKIKVINYWSTFNKKNPCGKEFFYFYRKYTFSFLKRHKNMLNIFYVTINMFHFDGHTVPRALSRLKIFPET